MKLFLNDKREPRIAAYFVGACIAALAVVVVNSIFAWPITWYIFPLSIALGVLGVFMIESGCEAVVMIVLASLPLAVVLWINHDYSLLKQIWLSVIVSHGAGKIWVGVIR